MLKTKDDVERYLVDLYERFIKLPNKTLFIKPGEALVLQENGVPLNTEIMFVIGPVTLRPMSAY